MENVKHINTNEKDDSDLLDCYRIAIDFGMPAALRAYDKFTSEDVAAVKTSKKRTEKEYEPAV